MRPIPRSLATLAALAAAAVLGACGTTPVPPPSRPQVSPITAPTPVPVSSPLVTPSPSPRTGMGLGCEGPIGRADELVLVAQDGQAVVVDAVGPDGSRRRLADLEDVAPVDNAQVSPCGHLVVQASDRLQVVDLRDPRRRLDAPGPWDGEWSFDRDGRLTVLDTAWGNVVVLDPRDGTTVRRPWNGDVRTYPTAAWDGSGWRAEVDQPGLRVPPARVGVVGFDGVFHQSAVLAYEPHGFLWWTRTDGAQAWEGWSDDEGPADLLDLFLPGGGIERWRQLPAGRSIEWRWWDGTGRTLWLLERGPDGLHVVHATGPGEASEAVVATPIPGWWQPLAIDDSAGIAVMGGPPDSGVAGGIVRLDLASGAVTPLVTDLDRFVVAGWAAPPTLPAGVVPPVPFGAPEAIATAAPGPTAPPIPLDAIALVTCSASGTTVARPTVRALDDGVHFLVLHPDGSAASVEDEAFRRAEGYQVVSLPPGPHVLDCGEGPGPTPARIEVLDPGGLYGRPPELTCEGAHGVTASIDGDPVSGPEAVAWLRSKLTAAPGDTLEPAGYPAEASPPILVVRDGRAVAAFHLLRTGGELGIVTTELCPDANIRW